MRAKLTALLTLICSSLPPAGAAAAGPAEVTFVDSSRYADAGTWGRARDENLARLEAHVQLLASQHLAPGQALKLEFLDIDLAGNERLWKRQGAEVRVLRGRADWPRLTLRYTLAQAGGGVQTGTESLSDMNYLARHAGRSTSGALAHEKRLLDAWFQARFGAAKQGG